MNKELVLIPLLFLLSLLSFNVSSQSKSAPSAALYSWVDSPQTEAVRIQQAGIRLRAAIANPEFMLHDWVELPTSPASRKKTIHRLSLREAILLALRYNPNIQNAELDRIVQRYQLRLAHN